MSRIIKTGSSGKDRKLLEKGIVVAIRQLAGQPAMDDSTLDILAFIALSLVAIGETIDESVAAWEKRGYWIKADHYRMEWTWASKFGEGMKAAIIIEDWGNVANITGQVAQKLSSVEVSKNNRLGVPWVGSYQKLVNQR